MARPRNSNSTKTSSGTSTGASTSGNINNSSNNNTGNSSRTTTQIPVTQDLLNFRYASSASSTSSRHPNNHARPNSHHYPHPHHPHYGARKQDRSAPRRNASSAMFPLISSADHSFVITRRFKQQYAFVGVDVPVSWSTVRMVKYMSKTTPAVPLVPVVSEQQQQQPQLALQLEAEEERCPICLEAYNHENGTPRITKCGHIFCLTCLIHHVQSYALFNPYKKEPTCPCCSLALHLDDVKPVQIISVSQPLQPLQQPQQQQQHQQPFQKMKFVKLHRAKACCAPYLPHPDQPKRSAPSSAPLYGIDDDAMYSKFNYVEPNLLKLQLQDNLNQLKQELPNNNVTTTTTSTTNNNDDMMMEWVCRSLACEFIERELAHLEREMEEETRFMVQFANPTSGIYQPQPPQLAYNNKQQQHFNNNNNFNGPAITQGISDHLWHDDLHQQQDASHSSWDHHEEGEDEVLSSTLDYSYNTANIASPHPELVENSNSFDGGELAPSQQPALLSPSPPSPVASVTPTRRSRGDSVASSSHDTFDAQGSINHQDTNQKLPSSVRSTAVCAGSMYLNPNEEEYVFYQAMDGTLCFLSAYNMKCLQAEFCTTLPTADNNDNNNKTKEEQNTSHNNNTNPNLPGNNYRQQRRLWPLPDVVEGRVVEIERVHLTADVRNRLRFLSHLPLFTDICFVELSLGHLLSKETKKQFQREFHKRQQARILKCQREQREKQRQLIQEQKRIEELKSRFPRIDPNDEFFHHYSVAVPQEDPEPDFLTGENFGPSLTAVVSSRETPATTTTSTGALPPSAPPPSGTRSTAANPNLSFSQICRRGGGTAMVKKREDEFPALGSSTTNAAAPPFTPSSSSSPWGSGSHTKLQEQQYHASDAQPLQPTTTTTTTTPGGKKNKKGKGNKIVLFSTGGHRGAS